VVGLAGLPDVIALVDGKFYGFEIKKDKNSKPSPLQLYNIEEINNNGGSAHIVWTLEQVKDIFCNQ
jgi:Holliday junction resolvase